MGDWRKRAEIWADVVYFTYRPQAKVKEVDEVYVWDLDKTYLDTRFETLKGLLRTAMEKPYQKRNVPGTGALVRGLNQAWSKSHPGQDLPLYFITASPPQMESKILEKLKLDQVHPYGLFSKDNLQNLRPKRLWRLTQQTGYKLQALLQLRQHLAAEVRQVLFGDDSESDAVIYSLYSDICARRLDRAEIRKVLKHFKVTGPQVDAILELQSKIPMQDPVEKIYINLEDDTDAEYYIKFGRRTFPSFSSFQIALDLFQDARIDGQHVVDVAQDTITNFGYTSDQMEKYLDDLVRRQSLGEQAVNTILPLLKEYNIVHDGFTPSIAPKPVTEQVGHRVVELEGAFEPWVPERIDYLHDYR